MRIIYKASVCALLTFCIFDVFGQITVAEPEYTGTIVYVDIDQAKPLEKQKATTKTKTDASLYITGIGKVKVLNNFNISRSTVRIAKRDSLTFIVQAGGNGVDPKEFIGVLKLEQNLKKNLRFFEVLSSGTFSGTRSNDLSGIPFAAKKYGEKSYLINIQKQLVPGEYAITMDGVTFSLFGVD